jgi:CheY-like chemotaxis protein
VLVNLAVNARDSMRDGGTLTIETSELPAGAGPTSLDPTTRYASLTVTDTGEGMAREVCERAFEPFFTTKTPRNGTGLGLSTSHGIIKHAGGTIQIESPPGLGTIVTILLPATLEEPAARAILPRPAPRGDGQLVLVVDDNVAVRNATSRTLTSHGYRVMSAHDGARALALCKAHGAAIDVLVSDLVMPVMAGSDLAIQAVAIIPSLQVILMSGYADEHLPRPRASDAPAVLQKPFPAATLLRKVAELLAARDGAAPEAG